MIDATASQPNFLNRIARWAGRVIRWSIIALLMVWLIGRILTDQYWWSQWLWWIPTPLALLAIVTGFTVALAAPRKGQHHRRRSVVCWAACGFAMLLYFSLIEHHLLRGMPAIRPTARALKVVHWNVIPGYLGTDTRIRSWNEADVAAAGPLLAELLALLPNLRAVILGGGAAQRTWDAHVPARPELVVVRAPHPSPTNVNTRPGTRESVVAAWRTAASA